MFTIEFEQKVIVFGSFEFVNGFLHQVHCPVVIYFQRQSLPTRHFDNDVHLLWRVVLYVQNHIMLRPCLKRYVFYDGKTATRTFHHFIS